MKLKVIVHDTEEGCLSTRRARRAGHVEFNIQMLGMSAGGFLWLTICASFHLPKRALIIGAVPAIVLGGALAMMAFAWWIRRNR